MFCKHFNANIRSCKAGRSWLTTGSDREMISEDEKEGGGTPIPGSHWVGGVGVQEMVEDLIQDRGNEVEARSPIPGKCQGTDVVDRQVGEKVDHRPGLQDLGLRNDKVRLGDLTTEEECREGLQIEGRRHLDGLLLREEDLHSENVSSLQKEEDLLWNAAAPLRPDASHLLEDHDCTHLLHSEVVQGSATGDEVKAGHEVVQVTPDHHLQTTQAGVGGPTMRDLAQDQGVTTANLTLAIQIDLWNIDLKNTSAGVKYNMYQICLLEIDFRNRDQ